MSMKQMQTVDLDRLSSLQKEMDDAPIKSYGIVNNMVDEVRVLLPSLYCKQCETEMYWPVLDVRSSVDIWKYKPGSEFCSKIVEKRNNTLNKVSGLKTCPICGASLNKSEGYFEGAFRMGRSSGIDYTLLGYKEGNKIRSFSEKELQNKARKQFDRMAERRLEMQAKEDETAATNQASSRMKTLLKKTEILQNNSLQTVNIQAVTSSRENLQYYIHSIIQMETNIIGLQKRLEQLYLSAARYKIQASHGEETVSRKKNSLEKEIKDEEIKLQSFNPAPEQVGVSMPVEPSKPTAPIFKTGLFVKKKNQELELEYQKKMVDYQQLMNEYQISVEEKRQEYEIALQKAKNEKQQRIESMKTELEQIIVSSKTELPEIQLINKEIELAETALRESFSNRNAFYALNIIFSKYRNLVALSSFYEYLITGRCSTLEGADGAYNLYENEIRMNLIISQLDQVISSLDTIKNTQYTIYSEIQEMNKSLKSLDDSMSGAIQGIHQQLDTISNNTAVTAYYSKINAYYAEKTAKLTNAIGWLVALK